MATATAKKTGVIGQELKITTVDADGELRETTILLALTSKREAVLRSRPELEKWTAVLTCMPLPLTVWFPPGMAIRT